MRNDGKVKAKCGRLDECTRDKENIEALINGNWVEESDGKNNQEKENEGKEDLPKMNKRNDKQDKKKHKYSCNQSLQSINI